MKTFFHAVLHSSYDMEFYRLVRQRSWTKALAYAALFFASVAVLMTLLIAPAAFGALRSMKTYVKERVPDGATFAISGGRFTTNLETPYDLGDKNFPIILDTSVEGLDPPDVLERRTAGVVIGSDAVFFKESEVELKTYSLKEFPDMAVTKQDMVDRMAAYGVPVLIAGLVILAVIFFTMLFTGSVIYALLMSAIALLIGRLSKINLRYEQWLAVGLHALTLPTVIDLLLNAMRITIPFAFTFIYFLFIIAVMADERARPTGMKPVRERKLASE